MKTNIFEEKFITEDFFQEMINVLISDKVYDVKSGFLQLLEEKKNKMELEDDKNISEERKENSQKSNYDEFVKFNTSFSPKI